MFKKEVFLKKGIFLFLLCFLCTFLLFSPQTGYADETNKLQDIIISLDSHTEGNSQVFTHQRILLESNNIKNNQENSLIIPAHFTFSEEEIRKLNSKISFTFENEESTNNKVVSFDNADTPFTIPIYAINPGVGSITFRHNNIIKQRDFEIAEQSILSELINQKTIPELPGVAPIKKQTRSNPAPPNSAATLNLSTYFSLNGNGSIDPTHKNVIVPVVPMANHHAGTMWSKEKIDLTKDFEMEMYTYSYNNRSILADGIALAFQNDPRGLTAIGGKAAGLSLYPGSFSDQNNYVANAIAIELDPFSNVKPSEGYDIGLVGHHMEYVKPGNRDVMIAQRSHDLYAPAIDRLNLNVNYWRLLKLEWDSKTKQLTTTYSDINEQGNATETIGKLTTKPLNIQEEFKGTSVYWGFGASTGGSTGTYYMSMKKMPDVMAGEITKTVKNITKKEENSSANIIATHGDEVEYSISLNNTIDATSISPTITDELTDSRQKLVPNSTKYRVTNSQGQQLAGGSISDTNWLTTSKNPTLTYQQNNLAKNTSIEITFRVKLTDSVKEPSTITNIGRMATTIGLNNSSNETTITMERYNLIEKYQDMNGNSIKTEKKTTLLSGSNYDSTSPKIPGYIISGYQIDEEPIVNATEDVTINFKDISKSQTIHYIYDRLITLNIRQIILTPSDELTIPKNGFLELRNIKIHENEGSVQNYNLTVTSSLDKSPVLFSQSQLLKGAGSQLSITPTIPEYYQHQGHIVTYENSIHNSGNLQNTAILLNLEKQQQFWITIYLTPLLSNNSYPAMYSWDTKVNNLGNISME